MNVYLLVTSKCNLMCPYCYEGKDKANKDMTLEVADKAVNFIIDKFKEDRSDRPLTIIFHGGEPLLNFEIIKYITSCIQNVIPENKVRFDMTTNGTIINDEIIRFIKTNIDNISISIDGTKESHNVNRYFSNGNGSYDIVLKNSQRLINEGISVDARMTFNSSTVKGLYEGVESISKMGFRHISPVTDFYDNEWDQKDIEVLENQIDKLIELKNKYPKNKISLIELSLLLRKVGDCFGGFNTLCIDEKGFIYPCAFSFGKSEFIIGNINDENISTDKLDNLKEIYIDENKDCKGCTRYENCIGTRCKILNKLVTGDYNLPPAIICASQKININTIKRLKESIS